MLIGGVVSRVVRSRVAASVVVAAAFAPAAAAQAVADKRPTLAVMYFNNNSLVDHDSYDALSKGIADVMITTLTSNATIRVIERDQLQALLEEQNLSKQKRVEPGTAVRIGKLLGAQHMIFGGFLIDRTGRVRLDARAVDVETSRIEHVESVTGKSDEIYEVLDQLSQKLALGLKLPSSPRATVPPRGGSGAAPRETVQGNQFNSIRMYSLAMVAEDDKDAARAIDAYDRFLSATPETVAPDQRRRAQERVRILKGGS